MCWEQPDDVSLRAHAQYMALVLVLLVILVLNSMFLRSCLGTAAWWVVFLSLFAAMWYGDFSWTVRIVLGALMVGLFLWRERRED